jgi:hypothetical protein
MPESCFHFSRGSFRRSRRRSCWLADTAYGMTSCHVSGASLLHGTPRVDALTGHAGSSSITAGDGPAEFGLVISLHQKATDRAKLADILIREKTKWEIPLAER